MNSYYNYQETLDIVEEFMIDSGIREYCETICKGKCCGDCYNSPNACFKNEGKRLPCSAYICSKLNFVLFGSHSQIFNELGWLSRKIRERLDGIMHQNPYFHVNTPRVQKKFKIPVDDVVMLKILDIENIKKKMKSLIENKIQVIAYGT